MSNIDLKLEEKHYEGLSPFELKNKLIEMANSQHERMMLNAGRGNPNWVALTPRNAFFQLGIFAMQEAQRAMIRPEFGKSPDFQGIAKRFKAFIKKHSKVSGVRFLENALDYVHHELDIDEDEFLAEMVDGILGDHYPTPDRMLKLSEKIVHQYLLQEMCGNQKAFGTMDLFATEGGTAAMDYIFTGLIENHLLHKGDKIAMGTPIFTPYVEIPRLNDFEFVEIKVEQDENAHWQYPEAELEKLADPEIKAFFLVNPSNPTAVNLHQASLNKIADVVKNHNSELIILTDDVYGTFVNNFQSLMSVVPQNTILVYSYSKYFGATGWRLGVIGIHQDNIFDKKIAAYPEKIKKQLHKRYSTVVTDPNKMKLVDRLVADSRLVALHHTAGLSTPQQVLMVLFSLFCLIDKKDIYKQTAHDIVRTRYHKLYDAIGIKHPDNPYDTHYYTIIDIPKLAEKRYGKNFKNFLINNFEPIDFVWRLAKYKGIVLMDGGGFDAPNMSVRVSLANLDDDAYEKIGKTINELLVELWIQKKKA